MCRSHVALFWPTLHAIGCWHSARQIPSQPRPVGAVAPGEAALPGWATLSGTLGDIEYLGPVTRFAVALADGALLHLMALAPPSMSGAVTVAYDPRRVVVMGAPP